MTTLPTEPRDSQLIELDARRRTTIRLGHHSKYLMNEEPDGTLVLRPAVVLTEDELILRSAPALVAQINRAMSDPSSRTRRGRPTVKD